MPPSTPDLDQEMVPRSLIRLPCRCQAPFVHWTTCSCMIGKWSLEVVVTVIPGSRNGLVSLSWLDAILITFARVRFDHACLSTSTIVQATATPSMLNPSSGLHVVQPAIIVRYSFVPASSAQVRSAVSLMYVPRMTP